MDNVFMLLFMGCFIALILGVIKPRLVIKWGDETKKTRKSVFKVYGLGLIASFILFGMVTEGVDTSSSQAVESVTNSVENNTTDKETKTDEDIAAEKEKAEQEEERLAAEKEAELKAAAKDPKNLDWNTKEIDAMENGNLLIAIDALNMTKDSKVGAESVKAANVLKTPWNYYGKTIQISGYVGVVQDFPPQSDEADLLGSDTATDIVIETEDGSIVEFMGPISSGNIQVGDYVTLYGYPIGVTEVENTIGGTFTHLILIGNSVE